MLRKISRFILTVAVFMSILAVFAVVEASALSFNFEFNTTTLPSEWIVIDPTPGHGAYSLTNKPGYLQYTINAHSTWFYDTYHNGWGYYPSMGLCFDLGKYFSDQWSMVARVEYNFPSGNGRQIGLLIGFDDVSQNRLQIIRDKDIDRNNINMAYVVGGVGTGGFVNVSGDVGTYDIFLVRNQNTLLAAVVDDSRYAIVLNYAFDISATANMHQRLYIGGSAFGPDAYAYFDYIRFSGTAPLPSTLFLVSSGIPALMGFRRKLT